ncbi:MAG: ABC-2 type transport system permease protein [Candidatus Paceibacteria bacterium]|jgi:ABC-2 type transport system permease protein
MRARLFRSILSIETRKLLSYRADFWINSLVGSLAGFALVYLLWAAIFQAPEQRIGGYSFEGMVLYYALAILVGRLVTGPNNPTEVAQDIYEGALTRYLLFPAPYAMVKYAQHIGLLLPSLIQLTLLWGVYLAFMPYPEEISIAPLSILLTLISLAVANALYYAMSTLLQLVGFWADNVWSLVVMLIFAGRFLGGAMIPLDVFPEAVRPWLAALPFRYLYGFPIDTLMGRIPPAEWAAGLVVSLLWLGVISLAWRAVWRRGMLQYTGVGI